MTASLDTATLWEHLSLPLSREAEDPARPARRRRRRRPGRPAWTAELFRARHEDAASRATPPHTYEAVAPHSVALDGTIGTSPECLRKLVRRFGLPPQ
ncbi:MAG: hypothetical protein ACC726_12295 [Chloroflexota bacterium]